LFEEYLEMRGEKEHRLLMSAITKTEKETEVQEETEGQEFDRFVPK